LHIHKHLDAKHGMKHPNLPGFFTEIDIVDISTKMAGVHFGNPYGLVSAPPATSYTMIRRGWGFAVTKTFVIDKDEVYNVASRIFKATNDILCREPSFSNIELVSEKIERYWVEGAKELKKDFQHKILIGSIMVAHNKKYWEDLARNPS
jgi:dihydropyrimidine dehydrogenase (NADP+)